MTQYEQQIAIMESCGWVLGKWGWMPPNTNDPRPAPDYLKDKIAMDDADATIPGHLRVRWQNEMRSVIGLCGGGVGLDYWEFVHATAAQRAEAFLRTIGKWRE